MKYFSKRTLFWTLYGLGLVLVSTAIFTLGADLKLGNTTPFASILNRCLAIIIAILLAEWIRTQLSLRHHTQDSPPADTSEAEATPHADITAFKRSFSSALAFLQKTKITIQGKQKHLSDNPWFLMIGPKGAGKSTLLAHSGQKFVLAKKLASDQFKRIKSTRFCDWWVTREAVILDLAGDFFWPQKNIKLHQQLWSTCLNLLKAAKPRPNLKAVILTVDLPAYLQYDEDTRAAFFKALRTRLQAINTLLAKELNVILLFTQCDKLSGFKAFFSSLDKTTREQAWGFELDRTQGDSLEARFNHGLSQMIESLNASVLSRMHRARDVSTKAEIKAFPTQLELAKTALTELVSQLPNVHQEEDSLVHLNVHGVFFSSSTQPESAQDYDHLLAPLQQAFELQAAPQFTNPHPALNYFTGDLFKSLIFKPQTKATPLQTKQRRLAHYAAYGVAASVLLGVSVFFANGFQSIVKKLYATHSALTEYQVLTRNLTQDAIQLQTIVPALDALQKAYLEFSNQHPSVLLNAKGNQQTPLLPILRQTYLNVLQNRLIPLISATLGHELAYTLKQPTQTPKDIYSTLKLYLMLAEGQEHNKEYIKTWISDYWHAKHLGSRAELNRLLTHLNVALSFTESNFSASLAFDHNLIEAARVQLAALEPDVRATILLEDWATETLPPVSLMPGDFSQAQRFLQFFKLEPFRLSPLYTAEGFKTVLVAQLDNSIAQATQGNAIFGSLPPALVDTDTIIQNVLRRYEKQFNHAWHAQFEHIQLKPTDTLQDFNRAYYLLTQAESPLTQFLLRVKEATTLPLSSQGRYNETVSATVLNINAAFSTLHQWADKLNEPASRDALLAPFQKHAAFISQIQQADHQDAHAFKWAKANFELPAGQDTFSISAAQLRTLPQPLKGWLTTLEADLWQTILDLSASHINHIWQSSIITPWTHTMANKYPVNTHGTEDMSLTAFEAWLSPQGKLKAFLDLTLTPFTEVQANQLRLKTVAGKQLPLASEPLNQLFAAIQIGQLFYPNGSTHPQFKYHLTAKALSPNVQKYRLNIHGARMSYPTGLTSMRNLEWPSQTTEDDYAAILFELENGQEVGFEARGPFALFKLFDHANIQTSKQSNHSVVTFQIDQGAVKYELDIAGNFNPLEIDFAKAFTLPASLIG